MRLDVNLAVGPVVRFALAHPTAGTAAGPVASTKSHGT